MLSLRRALSPNLRNPNPIFSLLAHHFSTDDADEFQSSRLNIFDRDLKRKQRDRAAWLRRGKDEFVDSVAENLLDRLEDCKRTFPTALCLGGSSEAIRRLLRGRDVCEGCVCGKQYRLPFPVGKSWRARKPLELVHADICGPLMVRKTLEQNGVVGRKNRTIVEMARSMLAKKKLPNEI